MAILMTNLLVKQCYNCSSANSAKRLRTTPSRLTVALPEKFLNFSTI